MKKQCFLATVLTVFLLQPPVFCPASEGENPNRFLGVERWVGTIDEESEWDNTVTSDCGSEGGQLKSGTIRHSEAHYSVDLPVWKDEPREKTPEEKQEEAQEKAMDQKLKQLSKLAGMEGLVDDSGEDSEGPSGFVAWGDQAAGSPGYESPLGSLGTGTFHANEYSSSSGCKYGYDWFRMEGSDTTSKIGAAVSILLLSEEKDQHYQIFASPHTFPGATKTFDLAKGEYEVCSNGHCSTRHYTTTSTSACDKEGNCTSSWKTTDPRADPRSGSDRYKNLPAYLFAGGGFAHGARNVDMSQSKVGNGQTPREFQNAQGDADPLKVFLPLPKTGMILSGSSEFHSDDTDNTGNPSRAKWRTTFRWNLVPQGKSDFDAEVEIEGYDKWVPKATHDLTLPGNTMVIKVRVLDKKTGKPRKGAVVKKYTFQLVNASAEPGVAMNWPWKDAADRKPDLRFEAEANPGMKIEDEGRRLVADDKKNLSGEETVVLSSFDWGAYADLMVTVEMGGMPVIAHLKGDGAKKKTIPLPKRKTGSHIADAWKEQRGIQDKKDDADDEDQPEGQGDGHKGDGFTLYEEYRGFYTDPELEPSSHEGHFYGDVLMRDVFVDDETGLGETQQGIDVYQKVTGFKARKITQFYMDDSRQINFNAGKIKNHNPQHGMILFWNPRLRGTSTGGYVPRYGTPKIAGEVNLRETVFSPEDHERVQTHGDSSPFDSYAHTVAHEMLHTSAVPHHGDKDLGDVEWHSEERDGKWVIIERKYSTAHTYDGSVTGFEPGEKIIRVFDEKTGAEYPGNYFDLFPVDRYVANQHGQHSGEPSCIMRYDVARAFDPAEGRSNIRFDMNLGEMDETASLKLCSSKMCHDVTCYRYGNAYYGNCRSRVCINDRFVGSPQHVH